MSRIGKKIIEIPSGVEINIDGQSVKVKGPKGELAYEVHDFLDIKKNDNVIEVVIKEGANKTKANALWGTNRQLVANMIIGVTEGFSKSLEINGVGYKAELRGKTVVLSVGFSHPVEYNLPEGVDANLEKNVLTLMSIDKQLLGETAANIRKIRKPEPYKGKGIKYSDEVIIRKAGKQVKSAA